jgi:transcription elongation factor Elf1
MPVKRELSKRSITVTRPQLPPLCPKCGSHRTRIVGTEKDSMVRRLRCLDCEKTSELVIDQE